MLDLGILLFVVDFDILTYFDLVILDKNVEISST